MLDAQHMLFHWTIEYRCAFRDVYAMIDIGNKIHVTWIVIRFFFFLVECLLLDLARKKGSDRKTGGFRMVQSRGYSDELAVQELRMSTQLQALRHTAAIAPRQTSLSAPNHLQSVLCHCPLRYPAKCCPLGLPARACAPPLRSARFLGLPPSTASGPTLLPPRTSSPLWLCTALTARMRMLW